MELPIAYFFVYMYFCRKFLMNWMVEAKPRSTRPTRKPQTQQKPTLHDYHSSKDLPVSLPKISNSKDVQTSTHQKAFPSSEPLHWVPLVQISSGMQMVCVRFVHVTPSSFPLSITIAFPSSAGSSSYRLPSCSFEETGFTEIGKSLGMPKRPAWRGVVK